MDRCRHLARRLLNRPLQLQMLWPESALQSPPSFAVPNGFELRTYRPTDQRALCQLMNRAGFRGWGASELNAWLPRALPDGYFLLVDAQNGRLAAATLAAHHPSALHPFGGELAWLAADPDYRGNGLGRVVCAATTRRLIHAGYHRIYLTTDDFRLAAIRLYLLLGYVPFLFDKRMQARWQRVYQQLEWPGVSSDSSPRSENENST
jgi:mycothiol synthase